MKEKQKSLFLRIFIAVFILISAVLAIFQAKSSVTFIAQLMGISWGALAGAFLAPFLYGLFWKKATAFATWASFVWGVGVMVLDLCVMTFKWSFSSAFMKYFFGSPINAGVLAMLGGLLLVPLVSLATKKPQKEHIDHVFSCYDKQVSNRITETLGN